MTKQESKQHIQGLIEKYERNAKAGKIKSFNEADTIKDFIEPLFESLGWDIRNTITDDEVKKEKSISGGKIDLGFYVNNIPVFFLEAKAMKIDLDEIKWAEQAINYSWNKGVTWAVLTDFETLKVFNAETPLKEISVNRFIEISYQDYINKFEQLWLLSKESFEQKLLDIEAERWGKIKQKKQVSEKLFEDLMHWRNILSRDFKTQNNLSSENIDEGVQKILDRFIFIRTAEDRKIEPNHLLNILRNGKPNYFKQLTKIFRNFDEGYNSKLFAYHFCEEWNSSDKVMGEIINGLYETQDGYHYNFSIISADVLGGIYEQYLGHIQGRNSEEKRKTKRKSQGIYYTKKYIVDFIIKETIEKILKKESEKNFSKIKILDPSCGSGSFLIAAYDKILEYFDKNNQQNTLFTKLEILKDNIYGVDLDIQAVEIAQLNLLLKVLSKRVTLPTLQHNVMSGNSLISGTSEMLEKYFGNNVKKHCPFNYEEEFKEVNNQGGFDAIIGNPPYIQLSMEKNISEGLKKYLLDTYHSSMGRLNTFGFFIRRGIELIKEGGYLGFIVPNTILTQDYYQELRKYILKSCTIESLVTFENLPFQDAVVENVILILKKVPSERKRNCNSIRIYSVNKNMIFNHTNNIKQNLFLLTDTCSFNISLNELQIKLKKAIEENSLPLSSFLNVNQAIALRHERNKWISNTKSNDNFKPLLIGGKNISRYSIKWDGSYLNYDTKGIHSGGDIKKFTKKEKIFFRRVSNCLIGALDIKQLYGLHTLVVMTRRDDIKVDIRYLLALFNSKLLNYYYKTVFASTKKIFSEIGARQVEQLPIKNIDITKIDEKKFHDEIVSKVNNIITLMLSCRKSHRIPTNMNQ